MGVPINGNGGSTTFNAAEVDDVRTWSLNKVSDNQPYVTSMTAGQTKRVEGNKDWTAPVTSYLDNGEEPPYEEGDTAVIELFTSSLAGVGGKWSGSAIVENFTVDVDIEGGAIIGLTTNYAANGALTFAANP